MILFLKPSLLSPAQIFLRRTSSPFQWTRLLAPPSSSTTALGILRWVLREMWSRVLFHRQ
uniref:Actin-related protein 3 isoform X2 n=1 Tax=Rhizophora mucronata TaxID=61149 RepID=A0A2P2LWY7_RHIMU